MANLLQSFGHDLRVIIIGASGGIGRGFLDQCEQSPQISQVYALSRKADGRTRGKTTSIAFDLMDEDNIAATAGILRDSGKFDLILVTTGLLQDEGITPEKNMKALNRKSLIKYFDVNTIGPALCAKYFLALLHRDRKAVFAALSARVGSISDNRLGGWYGYRASKAALNMVIKTLSLEFARKYPHAVVCGLHPGTVDTALSAPFQGNVPEGKLFTPAFSAKKMINVIDDLSSKDSGYLFGWDGTRIEF